MIAAIIPAKESSEGVPGKNLKNLGSKTLVEYTIEAALNSEHIDTVVLTTDSDEIRSVFERTCDPPGSPVAHRIAIARLPELTQPQVQVDEVVLFTLREMQLLGYEPDTVVVLQPTSPFRTAEHIDQAIELFQLKSPAANAILDSPNTVVGVADSGYAYGVEGDEMYPLGHDPARRLGRQAFDYDAVCVENGSLYVVDTKKLSEQRTFRVGPFTPFYMDWVSSFELDNYTQWLIAEVLISVETVATDVYNS